MLGSFNGCAIFTAVVKQRDSVKLVGSFAAEALRVLRDVPGLAVANEPAGADLGADAVLEFAGSRSHVAVQIKSRVNAATAWQVVREARSRAGLPVLVIAGETTADAREILEQHGVGVVDGLGNAHIELPGLLIHQAGGRPGRQARPARLEGKAGVGAQALLPGRSESSGCRSVTLEPDICSSPDPQMGPLLD
jgi:hypothetical protein